MAPGAHVPHEAPSGASGTRARPLNLPHKTCPIGQVAVMTASICGASRGCSPLQLQQIADHGDAERSHERCDQQAE